MLECLREKTSLMMVRGGGKKKRKEMEKYDDNGADRERNIVLFLTRLFSWVERFVGVVCETPRGRDMPKIERVIYSRATLETM